MGSSDPRPWAVPTPPPGWSGRIAFADLDHTLITVASLLDFGTFYLRATAAPRAPLDDLLRRLRAGEPRERVNRDYYRLYAGAAIDEVAALGRQWFDRARRRGRLFHPPVRAALRAHARAGDLVVLVSGSFAACVDPVAAHIGAHGRLCTLLEGVDGRYTGVVETSMIGAGRLRAVRGLATALGARPRDCHAYADHSSDLSLLAWAGHPCVVGHDPGLARLTRAARLPSAHDPSP